MLANDGRYAMEREVVHGHGECYVESTLAVSRLPDSRLCMHLQKWESGMIGL